MTYVVVKSFHVEETDNKMTLGYGVSEQTQMLFLLAWRFRNSFHGKSMVVKMTDDDLEVYSQLVDKVELTTKEEFESKMKTDFENRNDDWDLPSALDNVSKNLHDVLSLKFSWWVYPLVEKFLNEKLKFEKLSEFEKMVFQFTNCYR